MSTDTDLITGAATALSSVGTWSTLFAYQPYDTGIVVETMPATPDRCIALTVFPMTESPIDTTARWVLQVKTRGLPNSPMDALTLRGAVKDALNGLTDLTWGDTGVSQVIFYTSFPVGLDDSVRLQHVTKFWIDVDQAPTSLRPAGGWD